MKKVLTWIALIALSALVSVLAVQNKTLHQTNNDLIRRLDAVSAGPKVGQSLAQVRTDSLSGAPVRIGGRSEAPTVLYFFSSRCKYCRASLPQVRRIADSGALLVGIALRPYDEARQYATLHDLQFPIASDANGEIANQYEATTTPLLLVMDRTGKVVFKHVGQLSDSTVSDVLNEVALGAKQP